MADTNFSAGTVVASTWLNDVNDVVYDGLGPGGVPAASIDKFIQAGTGAVQRTVQNKARELISFEDFGADPTGVADSTSAMNAAVLAAYLSALNVLSPFGEIYSITVHGKAGADYKILGKVLLPSQVILDFNGARCIGPDAGAGNAVYSGAGSVMIATAYYDGAALQPNAAAASETTWRVVGAGVRNATFLNSNCPLDLTNFQEQCDLTGLRWSNCSAPLRMKSCFYSRVNTGIIRNSALAASQYAVLLHGAAAHDMYFDLRIVGASIGYEITATNSISVTLNGSLEEGYATNSIGIRNNGAYCQAWKVHLYCEGVRKGITTINSGAFFACDFSPMYFNSTEYAVQAGVSGFRACTFDTQAAVDGGGAIRNLLDFTAANNDAWVRMAAKGADSTAGTNAFPTNVLMGSGGQVMATSFWKDTTDASRNLALCDGRLANNSGIGTFPFEGRHIITIANQVPFWKHSAPAAGTTVLLDSQITYDESTPLVGHVVISDFAGGPFTFDFLVMGGVVAFPWAVIPAGKTLTATNNAGNYRLTFGNLNTNLGASYTVKGTCRMM